VVVQAEMELCQFLSFTDEKLSLNPAAYNTWHAAAPGTGGRSRIGAAGMGREISEYSHSRTIMYILYTWQKMERVARARRQSKQCAWSPGSWMSIHVRFPNTVSIFSSLISVEGKVSRSLFFSLRIQEGTTIDVVHSVR
jgi:hypothetical protein